MRNKLISRFWLNFVQILNGYFSTYNFYMKGVYLVETIILCFVWLWKNMFPHSYNQYICKSWNFVVNWCWHSKYKLWVSGISSSFRTNITNDYWMLWLFSFSIIFSILFFVFHISWWLGGFLIFLCGSK